MTKEEAETTLKDYLEKGILAESFWAEEAREMTFAIGRNSQVINARKMGSLFGRLQEIFSDRETLCVAKLFDRPSKKYPTRSIPAVLNLIKEHAAILDVPGRPHLEALLGKNGFIDSDKKTNEELIKDVVLFYESIIPHPDKKVGCALSASLDAIFQSRDKVQAHNEAVLPEDRILPKWSDSKNLVEFSKQFAEFILYGFFGIVGGSAALVPERNASSLELLLGVLGLTTDEFNEKYGFMVTDMKERLAQ